MVANKMTGEKGVLFTAKYVTKFEEMEKELNNKNQFNLPTTYKEALLQLVEQVEKNEQLEQTLMIVQPKADKYDKFLDSEGLIKGDQLAKIIGIGRNTMYKLLREKKIYMNNNIPYQKYMGDRGLFEVKTKVTHNGIKQFTMFTSKGADYVANLLKDKLN